MVFSRVLVEIVVFSRMVMMGLVSDYRGPRWSSPG